MEKSSLRPFIISFALGLFCAAAFAFSMLTLFTPSLAVAIVILFGPLVGLGFYSLYALLKWVRNRIGRKPAGPDTAESSGALREVAPKRLVRGFLIVYAVIFIGLALYDEKPDPSLVREMAQAQPEVLEPGNGWLIFLGFNCPEGGSPLDTGTARLRGVKDAVAHGKAAQDLETNQRDSKPSLSFQGKILYDKKRRRPSSIRKGACRRD